MVLLQQMEISSCLKMHKKSWKEHRCGQLSSKEKRNRKNKKNLLKDRKNKPKKIILTNPNNNLHKYLSKMIIITLIVLILLILLRMRNQWILIWKVLMKTTTAMTVKKYIMNKYNKSQIQFLVNHINLLWNCGNSTVLVWRIAKLLF